MPHVHVAVERVSLFKEKYNFVKKGFTSRETLFYLPIFIIKMNQCALQQYV